MSVSVRLSLGAVLACAALSFASIAAAAPESMPGRPAKATSTALTFRESGRWIVGSRTRAIAVDKGGRVLVAANEKVETYSARGKRLGSFSTGVSSPFGLAVRPNGAIYLSEYGGLESAVHAYSPAGELVGSFTATEGTGFSPWGLGVNPATGQLWIVNTIGPSLERADPNAPSIGGPGVGNGQFDNPTGIAYSRGSMYVVDTENHRIQRFDAGSGAFRGKWGQAGFRPGQLTDPLAVAGGPGGTVLVLDEAGDNAEIDAFTPSGRYLGTTELAATEAFGLATDKRGNAFVTGLLDYPRGGWGVLELSPAPQR